MTQSRRFFFKEIVIARYESKLLAGGHVLPFVSYDYDDKHDEYCHEYAITWPRGTSIPQLPSAVTSTIQ
jgi:hypothetical protein